jgi:AcrR family transcriptional regulator
MRRMEGNTRMGSSEPVDRSRPASAEKHKNGDQGLTARGRRTRTALIHAAREEFEAVGFSDARVADITARAKMSYGSFYTYFDDKEEIFREVVKQVTGEMFEASAVGGSVGADAIKKVEEGNRRYLRAYARNARIMSLVEEVAPYDAYSRDLLRGIRSLFVQRNEAGIRRLQEHGQADPEIDAAIAASALGGMVEQYARNVFLMGDPYDEDKAVETLTRLWVQSLRMET